MGNERVYNFSAGPSMLPLEVLERAGSEIVNYQGSGMSVMEMSHRSKMFDEIHQQAKPKLRSLLLMANMTYAGDAGPEGWVNMARRFEEAGADIIELNMCCPNMSYNLEMTSGGSQTASRQTGADSGGTQPSSARLGFSLGSVRTAAAPTRWRHSRASTVFTVRPAGSVTSVPGLSPPAYSRPAPASTNRSVCSAVSHPLSSPSRGRQGFSNARP